MRLVRESADREGMNGVLIGTLLWEWRELFEVTSVLGYASALRPLRWRCSGYWTQAHGTAIHGISVWGISSAVRTLVQVPSGNGTLVVNHFAS
jgi:hypothetical protein